MVSKHTLIGILYRLIINFLALGAAVLLFKHASVDGAASLAFAAALLTICNFFVKPIITFISMPFVVITLGLFYFVINGLVVLFVSWATPNFHVDGLWTAIGMSIIISVINFIFDTVYIDKISNR